MCALIGIGFHEIHSDTSTLHTLVVHSSDTAIESAKTRIATVTQRCDLTQKITEVLRLDDPRRVHSFQISYKGCIKQLSEVKAIYHKAIEK